MRNEPKVVAGNPASGIWNRDDERPASSSRPVRDLARRYQGGGVVAAAVTGEATISALRTPLCSACSTFRLLINVLPSRLMRLRR